MDRSDVLLTAIGVLNEKKWPLIPGLKNFRGKMMHSADWDDKFEYSVSFKLFHTN